MDAYELALVELLDHLGRGASLRREPAPRRNDSVAAWCARGPEAEAQLRGYLDKNFPRWPKGDEGLFRSVSFAELLRLLVG